MKKLIALIFLSVLMIQVNAQNTEPENRNNLVSFSMTRLFVSTMSFSYERLFESSGLMLSAGITLRDNNEETKTGASVELQYRLYPKLMREKVVQGFYIGPYLQYKYLEATDRVYCYEIIDCIPLQKNQYDSYGIGIAFGMKVAIAQRLVFSYELGGGLKYSVGTQKAGRFDIFHPGYTGIIPRADISLGYFF